MLTVLGIRCTEFWAAFFAEISVGHKREMNTEVTTHFFSTENLCKQRTAPAPSALETGSIAELRATLHDHGKVHCKPRKHYNQLIAAYSRNQTHEYLHACLSCINFMFYFLAS